MKFYKNISLILCFALFFCEGCVPKKTQPNIPNYVEKKLAEAAEAISKDMAELTGSRLHRDAASSSTDSSLSTHMDLIYDGPMDLALMRVAAVAGFRFSVEGRKPQTPPLVHMYAKDRSCLAILRELGAQTGLNEGILVSEQARTIVLRYGTGKRHDEENSAEQKKRKG